MLVSSSSERRKTEEKPHSRCIIETVAVLWHVAVEAERDLGQDAEGALAAHHDLIEVRTGGLPRIVGGDDLAPGRRVLLGHDEVLGAAVVGGVLAGASRDDPAADRGVLEGLGEVAAGVGAFRAEFLDRVVQVAFVVRAGETGLDRDGLVHFVEVEDLVVFSPHIEGDAAFDGFDAPGDGGTAAVDIEGDIVFGAVVDRLDNLFGLARVEDDVRQRVELAFSHAKEIVAGLAVHDAHAVIVALRPVVAVDALEEVHVLLRHFRGVLRAQFDLVEAEVHRVILEVLVRDLQAVFHHIVEGLLREFEEVGVAPAENGPVGVRGRRFGDPFRLEAAVRFVWHGRYSFMLVP